MYLDYNVPEKFVVDTNDEYTTDYPISSVSDAVIPPSQYIYPIIESNAPYTEYLFNGGMVRDYNAPQNRTLKRIYDFLPENKKDNLLHQLNNPQSTLGRIRTVKDQVSDGWGKMSIGQRANTILQTVGGALSAWNAHKTGKLAQRQLNHNIDMSNRNFENQRRLTNSKLEDRQKRRVEEAQANGRTTMSVSDYMNRYGV